MFPWASGMKYGIFHGEKVSWDIWTSFIIICIKDFWLTINNSCLRKLIFLQFAGGCTALLEYIYSKYIPVRSVKRRAGKQGYDGDCQDHAAEISATDYLKNCNCYYLPFHRSWQRINCPVVQRKICKFHDSIFHFVQLVNASHSLHSNSGWKVYSIKNLGHPAS